MAEEKEQLKIEAELDTSKLKQDARNGFNEVVNEEKKVQSESKNTSNAINDIGKTSKNLGKSMQSVGNEMKSAFRGVANEAKNTKEQIDEISKATKSIKLQQALGIVNRGISTLAPIGQAIASEAGMSDENISLLGGAITGASSGAMTGAALGGGWGAAGGALIGSATSLLGAAVKLKEAAAKQKGDAEKRYNTNIDTLNKERQNQDWVAHITSLAKDITSGNTKTRQESTESARNELKKYESENSGLDIQLKGIQQSANEEIDALKTKYTEGSKKLDSSIAEVLNKYSEQIESIREHITENNSKIGSLKTLVNSGDSIESKTRENLISTIQGNITRNNIANDTAKWNQYLSDLKQNPSTNREDAINQLATFKSNAEQARNELASISKLFQSRGQSLGIDELKSLVKRQENAQTAISENQSKANALESILNGIDNNSKAKSTIEDTGLNNLNDDLSKASNLKLTDALTRVGGGAGYGIQNATSNNVAKISTTLTSMLKELQKLNETDSNIPMGTFV